MSSSQNRRIAWITGAQEVAGSEKNTANHSGVSIFQWFEATVKQYPDAIALDDGISRLTFADVQRAVNRLAVQISTATEPGQTIAALLNNTVAFPIVLIASFQTGRVLVPIDLSQPVERQAAIFEETDASAVVVVESNNKNNFSYVDQSVPLIVVNLELVGDDVFRATVPRLDDPVAIAFTSGSTGRPKGIAFSLRCTDSFVSSHVKEMAIGPEDTILAIASLSAGGMRDAWSALSTGARLRLFDLKATGLAGLFGVMSDARVTILSFTASVMRQLMNIPGADKAFAHLRVLDLVGEPLTAGDIALLRSKLPPNCRISVGLGSTEALMLFRWTVRDNVLTERMVPVGYLLPGRRVSLVNDDGHSVGPGQSGELLVSDAYCALGRWTRGRLDRAIWRPDPVDPTTRIFFTGDVMRQRADGLFEFEGRRDRIVKVRGFRVDLAEIEAAIEGVEQIGEAAAVMVERNSDATVALFVTTVAGADVPSDSVLRRRVIEETAEHMAPSYIIRLEVIPRLPNYKPDFVKLTEIAKVHQATADSSLKATKNQ